MPRQAPLAVYPVDDSRDRRREHDMLACWFRNRLVAPRANHSPRVGIGAADLEPNDNLVKGPDKHRVYLACGGQLPRVCGMEAVPQLTLSSLFSP